MPKSGFKRILVAVDGSDISLRAVEFAAHIAKLEGATLTALHVIPSPQFEIPGDMADFYEHAKKPAKKWMKDITEVASQFGVTIKTEILVGAYSILDTVLGYAENQSTDLIVTGTRGQTQSVRLIMGSVASGLVQYASCSVLVIR
ncbi:MAG: universal stress protein [Nitrososphaerales archaeon]